MKKYLIGIIGVLIVWNVFLTFTMINLEIKNGTNTNDNTSVQQLETQIESDFTKLASKSESKVVGVNVNVNGVLQKVGAGAVYQVNDGVAIIVTSAQVVTNSSSIEIKFISGESRPGTLVGYDEVTDIAVIQVPINFDLEAFKLGDSSMINIGEWVISMGNPDAYRYFGAMEIGIITGRYKGINIDTTGNGQTDYQLMTFLTSMEANQGTVGGPVINMAGELIGINSVKWQEGLVGEDSTVIPINEVVLVVSELLENNTVNRGILGLGNIKVVKEMPIYVKNQLGIELDVESGLYIGAVTSGSLAEEAGIRAGDILWQIDGEDILTYKQYQKIIYGKESGETIELSYLKGGKGNLITVQVTFE